MDNRRVARVAEQLRREITDILRLSVRDPRVGMVTLTDVRVTSDLDQARVHVSIPGEEAERQESLAGLRAAAPFIRTELSRRMRVRRVPELRFELDDSLDHVRRIDELIAGIQREREAGTEGTNDGDDDVA